MNSKRVLAAGVTTLGVLAIWAMAAVRQEDQTRELGRQWAGEQWDIARRCLVGTPIGRSGSEAELADRLAAMALDTLSDASVAAEAPDPARLWPARCAPLLSRLDVDPSVTGGRDLSRPIAEVGALARHALVLDDVSATLTRARELAGPIHGLDGAMPPGAEYDPATFESPRADPAALEASLRCEEPAPARSMDCGEGAALTGEPLAFVRDGVAVALNPAAPAEGFVHACDAARAVVAWPREGRWVGTRCDGSACAPLEPLRADHLQLALRGRDVVAVTTGPWTDLPLARVAREDGWSEPVVVARGRLAPSGDAITACGERWTFRMP